MMSVEQYWPPEILAAVFPEDYGPFDVTKHNRNPRKAPSTHDKADGHPPHYTVESLADGCVIYRLRRQKVEDDPV